MDSIDGLHLVLSLAVVVLLLVNYKLHAMLDDAKLHIKMAAFTIAALAKGDAEIRREPNGDYKILRKEGSA